MSGFDPVARQNEERKQKEAEEAPDPLELPFPYAIQPLPLEKFGLSLAHPPTSSVDSSGDATGA